MSLNGMAESRHRRCHWGVWLKCSKAVANWTQVWPPHDGTIAGTNTKEQVRRGDRGTSTGQAPSAVLFGEAPDRPVVLPFRLPSTGRTAGKPPPRREPRARGTPG